MGQHRVRISSRMSANYEVDEVPYEAVRVASFNEW